MPHTIDAEVLYVPPTFELRFLPEGPYPAGDDRFSWVAIQHGADAKQGSLNIYDFAAGENRRYELPGRPGFAFATTRPGTFIAGIERQVGLFELENGRFTPLTEELEPAADGTLINDGVVFSGGIVFGFKDLEFKTPKAGLYFWRSSDQRIFKLRDDQICSNGKVIAAEAGHYTLLDIDTPTKQVRRYRLDAAAGTLSQPQVVLDLSDVEAFPDGMVGTPDGSGVIISFYHPGDPEYGETRHYRLSDGALETVWRTPGSPRNTCPQLIRTGGAIRLVITTAIEHMSQQQKERHLQAGCLFIAETPFQSLPPTPMYAL